MAGSSVQFVGSYHTPILGHKWDGTFRESAENYFNIMVKKPADPGTVFFGFIYHYLSGNGGHEINQLEILDKENRDHKLIRTEENLQNSDLYQYQSSGTGAKGRSLKAIDEFRAKHFTGSKADFIIYLFNQFRGTQAHTDMSKVEKTVK